LASEYNQAGAVFTDLKGNQEAVCGGSLLLVMSLRLYDHGTEQPTENTPMRIVDVESQLVKDFVDEIDVSANKENASMAVYVGRHPTLGKVVLIENKEGASFLVEVDE
jgi:hypothetical protein